MQNAKTLTLGNKKMHLLLLTTVGSKLHKLELDNSDTDLKAVFVWDSSSLFNLEGVSDTLDANKCDKDEWKDLMNQLNKEFNLDLEDDDDVAFFEAKKFFLTCMKNDSNVLDMLFSADRPVFCADSFEEVFLNRNLFLDKAQAFDRFTGMAKSSMHEARKLFMLEKRNEKQEKDLNKRLAKSLHFLHSFENFLKSGTHNPVLKDHQRLEVLEVKKGNVSFELVLPRFNELLNRVFDRKPQQKERSSETVFKLNKLLLELNLSCFNF